MPLPTLADTDTTEADAEAMVDVDSDGLDALSVGVSKYIYIP